MAIPFLKMHGLGNDYVFLNAVARPDLARREDLQVLARAMSDRNRGIGSDGLILVSTPTRPGAHLRMRIFNADGGEAQMCGNGVRCVAKLAHDRLGFRESPLRIQTGGGTVSIDIHTGPSGRVESATVDMGRPILDVAAIPFDPRHATEPRPLAGGAHDYLLKDVNVRIVPVSTGNPHAVVFVDERSSDPEREIRKLGPVIERHPAFPEGVNVHLVQVAGPRSARMWTWERGSGITQACGTGACAVLVAGVLAGRLEDEAAIDVPGGRLRIRRDPVSGSVFKTGPAEESFTGEWPEPADRMARSPLHPGATTAVDTTQPTLTTPRFILRPFTMDDVAAVTALASDRRIHEFTLTIPHPYLPENAATWISSRQREWEEGRAFVNAIVDRTTGQLVGAVGLAIEARHGYAELGYWIGVPFWGRGVATETSAAVIAFGFDRLKLNRIHAYYFPANPVSGRVLVKLGMTTEGTMKQDRIKNGVAMDSVLMAMTRDEWAARTTATAP